MTDIIITRSEESLKTLFHELIHFHSLDFKHPLHDDFCIRLFNIDTEQSSFNLFEAHTECLASILQCLTRTPPSTEINDSQHVSFNTRFADIFAYQVFYTIKKAAQILNINNCSELSEFIHLDSMASDPTTSDKCLPLRESTNVFSYYFVKTFIYLGISEWLTGCCNSRTCQFIDNRQGQQTLLDIIKSGARNPLLYKLINSRINKPETQSLQMVWIK